MNAPMNPPMNEMIQKLSLDAVRVRLDLGRVTLIEALPARYFEAGHLPGAININHDEIGEKAPHLLPDREAELIVYCSGETCMNSHKAAARLRSLGYTNVAVFGGGKAAWEAAGMRLVQG